MSLLTQPKKLFYSLQLYLMVLSKKCSCYRLLHFLVSKCSQVRQGVSRTAVEFVRAPDRLSNTVEQGVCCDQCALDKIQLMAALLLKELQTECISYGNELQLREKAGDGGQESSGI